MDCGSESYAENNYYTFQTQNKRQSDYVGQLLLIKAWDSNDPSTEKILSTQVSTTLIASCRPEILRI